MYSAAGDKPRDKQTACIKQSSIQPQIVSIDYQKHTVCATARAQSHTHTRRHAPNLYTRLSTASAQRYSLRNKNTGILKKLNIYSLSSTLLGETLPHTHAHLHTSTHTFTRTFTLVHTHSLQASRGPNVGCPTYPSIFSTVFLCFSFFFLPSMFA